MKDTESSRQAQALRPVRAAAARYPCARCQASRPPARVAVPAKRP